MNSVSNSKKKKSKTICYILLTLFLLIIAGIAIYCYTCTYYWQKDYKKTLVFNYYYSIINNICFYIVL